MATLIQRFLTPYLDGEVYPPQRTAPSRPRHGSPRSIPQSSIFNLQLVRRSLGEGGSSIRHPTQHQAPSTKHAFTLIELLVVMAIMVIMLGLSIAAFKDIGSGAGMRGAVLQFKTNLSLARQYAITHRYPTYIRYMNGTSTRGYFWMEAPTNAASTNMFMVGNTNYLSEGIIFEIPASETTNKIEFKIDGTIRGKTSSFELRIRDLQANAGVTNSTLFKVYPQTGRVKVFQGIQ